MRSTSSSPHFFIERSSACTGEDEWKWFLNTLARKTSSMAGPLSVPGGRGAAYTALENARCRLKARAPAGFCRAFPKPEPSKLDEVVGRRSLADRFRVFGYQAAGGRCE